MSRAAARWNQNSSPAGTTCPSQTSLKRSRLLYCAPPSHVSCLACKARAACAARERLRQEGKAGKAPALQPCADLVDHARRKCTNWPRRMLARPWRLHEDPSPCIRRRPSWGWRLRRPCSRPPPGLDLGLASSPSHGESVASVCAPS